MKLIALILLNIISINSYSSTIAILDNGVDYTHQDLTKSTYRNTAEVENGSDDDGNGYIDDILGWNFIAMNNITFDFSRKIYLTEEIKRYYFLRAKNTLETISDDEKSEYNILKKDKELTKKRKEFVSWMHGTHVAGIAANLKELPREISPQDIKLISITYLGSATFGPAKSPSFHRINSSNTSKQESHLANYWEKYLDWQLNKLKLGVDYAASKANVVNGSFGQSFEGIQDRMKNYYKKQFDKVMPEKLSFDRTNAFMQKLVRESTKIVKKYPETLFVFSAGNKKNNSDKYIHFPSAIRLENSLSIGASFDYKEMAYFSNYGERTVDIFAPGMAIRSTIPRQEYLRTNGTSQAAPFISNVAIKALAQAKKLNIKLKISELKEVILKTALKKDDLRLKSVSEGIIFPERVFQAIRNLKSSSLSDSIKKANMQYPTKEISAKNSSVDGLLLELPHN